MGDDRERGFTIVDKRGEKGDAEETAAAEEAPPPEETQALPPVDFTGFVLSLGTSALYHLGLVADPQTGEPAPPDLPLARETIDTLELLQDKTRGNLTDDEGELLTTLLTELRMRYVERSGGS